MKYQMIVKSTLVLILALSMLFSMAGCGLKEKIVDFLLTLDPVETQKVVNPPAAAVDVLAERIPLRVENVDLNRATVEECYGYEVYRLSGLYRSDVMSYVQALSGVEHLIQNEAWDRDGGGYYCQWSCSEHRQALQICFLGETMILTVGDSWYLPAVGNCFVLAGLPVDQLGELAYDPNENTVLDVELATPIMLNHHQIRKYENASFESVYNLVFKLRQGGYRDSLWTRLNGICDNPTEQGTRICERMIWGGKELVVLYSSGRAMLVEGESAITMTEEELWSQLGVMDCYPGYAALGTRMEAFEFTPMVDEERGNVFSIRGNFTPEDYRALIELLTDDGYKAVILDETAPDGTSEYIVYRMDSYASMPCSIYVGLTLDARGELEIRMGTKEEAVRNDVTAETEAGTGDVTDTETLPA